MLPVFPPLQLDLNSRWCVVMGLKEGKIFKCEAQCLLRPKHAPERY